MKKSKKIKTKDKIIQVAIDLFNEHGIQSITSRHIATEIGIAYGNVDYHYKNKEELLIAIYQEMRYEMSNSYILKEEYSTSLEHFHRLLTHLEQFQYKYRFFNLDVLEVCRTYPKINKIIEKTLELRKQQMANLFDEFIIEGFLEERTDDRYDRLQHTLRIVITFWLSQEEVLTNYSYNEKGEMSRHIWELIFPYLTDSGIQEYNRLVTKIVHS